MRHFGHLSDARVAALFERPPEPFDRHSPADRPARVADVTTQAAAGVTSVVLCLEDAVADERVDEAEANLVDAVRTLHDDDVALPLLFVRVRRPAQIPALVARLGAAAEVLDGFVLPKFTAASGTEYLLALDEAGPAFRAMPVIESGAVLYAETRVDELNRLRTLLHRARRRVLAVRLDNLGDVLMTTDLCALYGLRRTPELSIYDIAVVADLIGDVVNVLGRTDGTGFTVTGPVWEYYGGPERIFKPQLRSTPFDGIADPGLRGRLVSRAIDGLIREALLDRANGLTGKTAIHPTHVGVVNALSVVSSEEYRDALDVLAAGPAGGVLASGSANKMNEVRPHHTWARRTLLRSRVFGVVNPGVSAVDLVAAGL